jgi:hypothetical protein
MKKIVALILLVVVFISGCRKEDNPKVPDLTRFPLPLVQRVTGSDEVISAQNPSSFTGKFTVDLYFKSDEPPQKFDVVAIKNGNVSSVKTIQAGITTFPTTITLTGAQLINLFGSVAAGDRFDISVDVTTAAGVKYEAFPAVGNAYASGVVSQPGASTSVRYEALCTYDPNIYQGNFVVITDEWADYLPGDIVPLTKVDATHFSFKYAAANAQPIVVTVNANTNVVSVAKQVYGSGYPPGWTYGDISAQSVASANNFVAPCTSTFSVVLQHTTSGIDWGTYKIVLKKQ